VDALELSDTLRLVMSKAAQVARKARDALVLDQDEAVDDVDGEKVLP
jgi:hypothetical protein